jgi:hypothetical protein
VRSFDALYFREYSEFHGPAMPYLSNEPAAPAFLHRMLNAHPDGCCTPAPAIKPAPVPRRARLADLDAYLHCSIIGTCLTTGELRKLVPRYAPQLDRKSATDLEIHHTAVELSTQGEGAAKELHKALDTRHALAIKRFKQAADEAALETLWREALAHGDVPGAYWALLTHPLCSLELLRQAFGDVHMLSHLVGASNRADLRRLTGLEEECARLRTQNAAQQARLQQLGAQHHQDMATAEQQATQLALLRDQHADLASSALVAELAQLRAELDARNTQLALQSGRRAEAEALLESSQQRVAAQERELNHLRTEADCSRNEAQALEQALEQALAPQAEAPLLPQLHGRSVLYVGGRPQSTTALTQLVAAAGGELLSHDGGIEDRKGMLSTLLPRAQLVVFPVDCISHNAMHVTRQLAERAGIPCHPLRTASVGSFVELMRRLDGDQRWQPAA